MVEDISNKKELSPVKIIYLIIFLFFAGIIILYAGGVLTPLKKSAIKNVAKNDTALTVAEKLNLLEADVKKNPNDAYALLNLANLLNDSGAYSKAIKNYKKYLKINPDNADVLIDMGVCYFQLGNYKSAADAMEKGIEINPNHQVAYFNLGIVSSANGNESKALKYWNKAIKINPDSKIGIEAKKLLDNHTKGE